MNSGRHTAPAVDAAELCREGATLVGQRRLEEALERFLDGVRLFPTEYAFPKNAALVLHDLQRFPAAVKLMGTAIERAPAQVELYTMLAAWLLDLGQPDTAARLLRRATLLEPKEAEHQLRLGIACLRLKDADAAAAALERALEIDSEYLEAHCVLGVVRTAEGRHEEAEVHFRRAMEIRPSCGLPYYHLARAGSFTDAARIEALLLDPAASRGDRSRMHFALGFLYDRSGEHDRAFTHLAAANALEKRDYDPQAHRGTVAAIAATFTRELLDAHRGGGDLETTPIFIVGLPRSGSTLVEEILSCHPRVCAIGEHSLGIPRLMRRLRSYITDPGALAFPAGMTQLTGDGVRQMARDYLASISPPPAPGAFIVDKMLDNYQLLGLIELLFPRARILHCRRHPIDSALSAYSLCFARNDIPWSYDLEHLAMCHEDYSSLMAHWERTSGLAIMDVVYEELVADPEAWTARILEFCGLGGEDLSPRPTSAPRVVFTSSAQQVRAKIHRRACGRWKPYAPHLGPLLRLVENAESC